MTRVEISEKIKSIGILPAVRVKTPNDALFAADELGQAGIGIIEVTVTDASTLCGISELAKKNDGTIVGAGEVLHPEIARQCYDAGAMFITSPGFNHGVVEFAHMKNVAVFPGALSPTEVMAAWHARADFIKIFPCTNFGGARYIRALRTPFPNVPLIASGGVNTETAADFLRAGADVLGIGTALIPPESVVLRQASRIRNLAGMFADIVNNTRVEMESVRVGQNAMTR